MKPRKLTLQGFGSYGKESTLDMASLGDRGLYLIAGNTGSGKTTLFDAISYALYGEASGEYRGDGKILRGESIPDDMETYVCLLFEHHGNVYEVRRNMEYLRKSRGGTRPVKQLENVVLTLPDGLKMEGKRVVDPMIVEILGIQHDHFTRIMMIAQGDFQKVLMAKTDERQKILRQIFNTTMYEAFQNALKARTSELQGSVESACKRIEEGFKRLDCPLAHPFATQFRDALERASAYQPEEALAAAHELILRDIASHSEAEKGVVVLKMQLRDILSAIVKAEATNEKLSRLQKATEEYRVLLDRESEILGSKARLVMAERAASVGVQESDMERAKAEQRAKEIEIEGEKTALAVFAERLPVLKKEHEALLDQENAFVEQEWQRVRLIALRPQYEELARVLEQITACVALRASLQKSCASLEGEAENASRVREKAQARLKALADVHILALETKVSVQRLSERYRILTDMRAEAEKLKAVALQMAIEEHKAEKAMAKAKASGEACLALEGVFWQQQAGLMAKDLQKGVPCPVCGALEHPNLAALAADAPTQDVVQRAKEAYERNRETAAHLSESLHLEKSRYRERLSRLKDQLLKESADFPALLTPETLACAISAALLDVGVQLESERERLNIFNAQAEEANVLQATQENMEAAWIDASRRFQEHLKRLGETRVELEGLHEREKALQDRLPFATGAEAEREAQKLERACAVYRERLVSAQRAWQDLLVESSASESNLAMLREQARRLIGEADHSQRVFYAAIQVRGFMNREDYAGAKMDVQEMAQLRDMIRDYENKRHHLFEILVDLKSQTDGLVFVDTVALAQQKAELDELLDVALARQNELSQRLSMNRAAIREIGDLLASFSGILAEYEDVHHLSDIANGRAAGMAKLTFENYVLADCFDRVVVQANQRFRQMTGGQYELLRATEVLDRRSRFGLELDVINHLQGTTRNVRSLSGGESFIASLALALGFADEIQQHAGGIVLDTMFIDEGFGSLDERSLDQVMDALALLSCGNKLVGIISHVAELRTRIERKIIVEKTREGSRAWIE